MKKIIFTLIALTGFLFQYVLVHAETNITLSPKTATPNSITVTIKNNGPAGMTNTGTYNSIFNGKVFAINPSTATPDNSSTVGPIPGGESREVTIAGLNPSIAYSIEVQEGGGFYAAGTSLGKIIVSTKPPTASTVVCTAPKVLVNGICITPTTPPTQTTTTSSGPVAPWTPIKSSGSGQCNDGKDNQVGDGVNYGYGVSNGDHKADHLGVDVIDPVTGKGDGVIDMEPDPSCFSPTSTEEKGDDVVSTIIPCTDKCTFTDVFRLLNNFLKFFITVLLIPLFIIIIMYAGFKYITAEGNPSKVANIKKMLWNILIGIIIVLCAWLIVRTIMTTLLNEEFKQSGVEFLGN